MCSPFIGTRLLLAWKGRLGHVWSLHQLAPFAPDQSEVQMSAWHRAQVRAGEMFPACRDLFHVAMRSICLYFHAVS